MAPRKYYPRRKGEPHEVRPKADREPTAAVPAQREGRELGAEAERDLEARDLEDGQRDNGEDRPVDAIVPYRPRQVQEGGAAGSGGADGPPPLPPPPGRGPDREPRERRTFRDIGVNPPNAHDWTDFDIGRVVRMFRTNKTSAIRLSLRKLHVRWWHASEHTMKGFLDRVGVSQKVLGLIPEICQTCRVCREWAKPGPANAMNVELADKFNSQVECDLLFVHKYIIFHMLDRCFRWHAARVIENKEEGTLMRAIDELWVSVHGPPKELISDGESGIMFSALTQEYLARKGIRWHGRGKDQHARFVERRGALLRDTIHRVEGQLEEEGIAGMPFTSILSECVFCGNALLTVGGSTPYNALYGRVPHILPSINQLEDQRGGEGRPADSTMQTLRHVNRLREISAQAMIEGSARARLGRAMNKGPRWQPRP